MGRGITSKGRIAAFVAAAVAASVVSAPQSASFTDVDEAAWYAPAVAWFADSGLTVGTPWGCYEPERALTRAEAAVFLHRLGGSPEPTEPLPFADMDGHWAAASVRWMAERGITRGVAPDRFGPEQWVTRGQFAAFLHRYEGEPTGPPHPFVDVTAAYQQEAVSWLASTGITQGTTATTFSPDRVVTRAEIAAFLHRHAGEPSAAMPYSDCREPIVVHGVGDVNFDPGYGPNPQHPYSYAWSGLGGLFLRDDLSIINLECAPSERGSPQPKAYTFRCPYESLVATADAGVEVANLANNHGGDFGVLALLDGLDNVRAAGMAPVGAGENLAAAITPALFEIDGTTIAVLGFNAVGIGWRAYVNVPGMADGDIELMTAAVEAADEIADIVLVSIHWGIELARYPRAVDVARGRALIDAGADAVFGHHPHVLQPLEVYNGRPIFWSLGNFVWHANVRTTAIARVVIGPDGSVTGSLIPARIAEKGHPVLA